MAGRGGRFAVPAIRLGSLLITLLVASAVVTPGYVLAADQRNPIVQPLIGLGSTGRTVQPGSDAEANRTIAKHNAPRCR